MREEGKAPTVTFLWADDVRTSVLILGTTCGTVIDLESDRLQPQPYRPVSCAACGRSLNFSGPQLSYQ